MSYSSYIGGNPSNPVYQETDPTNNPFGFNPLGTNFVDFGLGSNPNPGLDGTQFMINQPGDVPHEIRERGRGLPMRLPAATREIAGQELEFIFRSLVELKLQVEELRRRLEERPQRVEVIEVGPGAAVATVDAEPLPEGHVVYRAGMTMADVERAAIEAALKETRGNRRRAADVLGIGERTLYRKLKEYALA